MLNQLFSGLFSSGSIDLQGFLISLLISLVLGVVAAAAYSYKNSYSKGFLMTLALLPGIVSVIIMMVSGSLGASVAVAGTFSLVRFRSKQGTAKEICAVFLSMAIGLACGMGYPAFAVLFTIILCLVSILYEKIQLGVPKNYQLRRLLKITIPEDLDYTGVFDDLFEEYTTSHKLVRIKTTDLGSLNKLTYEIALKEANLEKKFIDALRIRNGNLEISMAFNMEEGNDL